MHSERLMKLANFLRSELCDDLWDFGHIMVADHGYHPKEAFELGKKCGTAGCAIGWCPIVFPKAFKWMPQNNKGDIGIVPINYPLSIIYDRELSRAVIREFFDIDDHAIGYMFEIFRYETREKTTRFQVADRIENFVQQRVKEQEVVSV